MRELDQVIEEVSYTQQGHESSEVEVEFALHALVHRVGVALEKQDEGHEERYKGQEYDSVGRRHHSLTHFEQSQLPLVPLTNTVGDFGREQY